MYYNMYYILFYELQICGSYVKNILKKIFIHISSYWYLAFKTALNYMIIKNYSFTHFIFDVSIIVID